MADGVDDQHAPLREALEQRLGVTVRSLSPLSGGACQDNYRVDLDRERRVLRCDAATSLPGSIDRAQEHAVIRLALSRGVCTPQVHELLADIPRPGAHGYLMSWVDGVAIGRKVVKDPALAAARDQLPAQLARELATIHSITPPSIEDRAADNPLHSGYNPDPSVPPAQALLASARTMMDGMKEPHLAMELAYDWLTQRAPEAEETVLVHGDFRTGNFMVGPDGLVAILDWEYAHWGSPVEDLAWIGLRDWRFGVLARPIGGFGDRDTFYAAYEEHSGRRVDRDALAWWEVAHNLVWGVGCVYQGERYLSGEENDFELVAIGRRSAEMEWEALRLIARAADRGGRS